MMRTVFVLTLFLSPLVFATSLTAQTTAVSLYSDSGHLSTWTPPAYSFSNGTDVATRSHFLLRIQQDGFVIRTFRFLSPIGRPLAPGVYEPTYSRRSEFGAWPEFDFGGPSCLDGPGRFEVYEARTDGAGRIISFAADFEYHCGEALYGAVRYNSSRSSLVPFEGTYGVKSLRIEPVEHGYVTGSGIDCGAGRLDCDETYPSDVATTVTLQATALPGYVLLGWIGPCAGETTAVLDVTRPHFCTPVFQPAPDPDSYHLPEELGTAAFLSGEIGPGTSPTGTEARVFALGALGSSMMGIVAPSSEYRQTREHVRFGIEGAGIGIAVAVEFRMPAGSVLTPGRYLSPVTSPTLFLSANESGSECSDGEFTIYELEFDSTQEHIVRFAADFSIGCGWRPVVGSIRYRSTRRFLFPYGIAPAAARVLTVVPTLGGSVTAQGIACGSGATDCAEPYEVPANVTLTATPASGYDFLGWSGDCAGTAPSTTVFVDRQARCYPVFAPAPGSGSVPDATLGAATVLLQELTPSGPTNLMVLRGAADLLTAASEITLFPVMSVAIGPIALELRNIPALGTSRLHPGDHEEEYPNPGSNVVSLTGCEQNTARLRVYEAGTVGSRVLSLTVDFEARCQLPGGATRHLLGAVRYQSNRADLVPFGGAYPFNKLQIVPSQGGIVRADGIDCGPGRAPCARTFSGPYTVRLQAQPRPGYKFLGWAGACEGASVTTMRGEWLRRCEALFSPLVAAFAYGETRSVLFFDSEPGEPVGQGRRQGWVQPHMNSTGSSPDAAQVTVTHPDGRVWWLRFEAPAGQHLVPGTYDNATDALSAGSGPALHIRSSGHTCSSELRGRFVVYWMNYFAQTTRATFAIDFEQQCSPGGPLLRGTIRFHGGLLAPFTPATLSDLVANRPVVPETQGTSLFWQHHIGGHNALWQMHGVSAAWTGKLLPAGAGQVLDPQWDMRTSADMNGDGSTDLIWQHRSSGRLAVWFMSGPTLLSAQYLYDVEGSFVEPDPDWMIVAAGDTDLDGHPDLLWRHETNGAIRLWHMRGTQQWDSVDLGRVTDQDWRIVGLSDVDGDGLLDIVWAHQARGVVATWFTWDGYLRSTAAASHTQPVTSWRVAGVADMNGDRRDDLVWHQSTTGALGVWFMQGLTRIGARPLEPSRVADLNWRLAAVK